MGVMPKFRKSLPNSWVRPTECRKCEPFFDEAMQAEALLIGVREGESAARQFVDEKLGVFHEGH